MKIFKSSIHFSKLAGVWKVFFYVITIVPIHSPLVLLLLQHIFSWRNHSPISMISFKAISAFYFSAFLLFEYSTFSAKSFLFILSKDIFSYCLSSVVQSIIVFPTTLQLSTFTLYFCREYKLFLVIFLFPLSEVVDGTITPLLRYLAN